MNILSTKEIATGLWLLVLLIFILLNKKIRNSFIHFIKMIFRRKIILLWLPFFLYIGIITFFISRFPFWKSTYLKDIIIWSITSGVIACLNSADKDADDDYIVKTLKENIKPVIIIGFIRSIFTFNIIIEILIVPVITILTIMPAYTKKRAPQQVKFWNNLLSIVGWWIICGTINVAIDEVGRLNYLDTLISFLIPFVFLIAIIPMMVFWLYVSKYELLFIRMAQYENNIAITKKIKNRIDVFNVCGLSCKRILRFMRGFTYLSCVCMTEKEFSEILNTYRNDSENDSWYMTNTAY
ncbi:hypothetical protein SAMN02910413_0296 [Pseudobutyrivibrio sp. C4]|uniref:hypothetical protein n=1 Tax=Pseudobutyrivibrio sp. C4 TaxID=1520803 RepID=UPI0008BD07C2|nr:hypothetical protein [Pseudobutyrivibrio sp. C4]SES65203.1 hypothetical protein SAMN02910413_0296 [Pseudobutyrivibrio sp. C4]